MRSSRRPTSTKTRIETQVILLSLTNMIVADQHPLKQGLKLITNTTMIDIFQVADQHPLKQGLKLVLTSSLITSISCRRPTSTKTRIETLVVCY